MNTAEDELALNSLATRVLDELRALRFVTGVQKAGEWGRFHHSDEWGVAHAAVVEALRQGLASLRQEATAAPTTKGDPVKRAMKTKIVRRLMDMPTTQGVE